MLRGLFHHSRRALLIFALTVGTAATGLLPIVIATLLGALLMIATGCISVQQAARAIDRRIYLLVGTAFAMALPLQATGGAQFIAHGVVATFAPWGPAVLLSALFLMTALMTSG